VEHFLLYGELDFLRGRDFLVPLSHERGVLTTSGGLYSSRKKTGSTKVGKKEFGDLRSVSWLKIGGSLHRGGGKGYASLIKVGVSQISLCSKKGNISSREGEAVLGKESGGLIH